MLPQIAKLLSLASEPIAGPQKEPDALDAWGRIGDDLAEMLKQRNGFFAYESALLVRPLRNDGNPCGLLEWNEPGRWRFEYSDSLADALFFAEDVFGGQYCIHRDAVCTFDP